MADPYSNDLRERVVAAVGGGLSRRRAADRFGVSATAAINWVKRARETGSVSPGQIGGHRPRTIQGEHETWLAARIQDGDFTLRGLVVELAERGLDADYSAVWAFVHAHGLTHKKRRWSPASKAARTSPAGGVSG